MDPQYSQIVCDCAPQSCSDAYSAGVSTRNAIGVLLVVLLTGCHSSQDIYLAQATDHATAGELEQVLGRPNHKQVLETGRRFWLYHREAGGSGGRDFMPYCQNLWLTFDQEGILRAWQKQRC